MKKMEQHGVIRGYTVVFDNEKIGRRKITALVTIVANPRESEKVAEKLCKVREVLEVYSSISDELSIMAKVVADTQEMLHDFIANSVAPIPGVLRIRTAIVTKKFKETALPIDDSPKRLTIVRGKRGEVKKVDIEREQIQRSLESCRGRKRSTSSRPSETTLVRMHRPLKSSWRNCLSWMRRPWSSMFIVGILKNGSLRSWVTGGLLRKS
jgi:DNA-binding Lrp family transcriptional regulator